MVWLRVPYLLLKQRYTRGQNQNAQTQGQQDFPSHLHELVKAISGERATIPDIEVHESGNFRGEPKDVLDARAYCRNEQNDADQAKDCAESREPNSLNAEQRMLRHAHRVVKTNRREKQKRDAGDERKNL